MSKRVANRKGKHAGARCTRIHTNLNNSIGKSSGEVLVRKNQKADLASMAVAKLMSMFSKGR